VTAPRLDDQLCFQLYTASRLVTRAYRPLLSELGITYPQYIALMVLWEWNDGGEPAQTVGALGERLLLDSGTLTPLLKRMEQNGLVKRSRDTIDERVVRIELTKQGVALSEQAARVPMELACKFKGDVDELMVLRESVRNLVEEISSR
jgi:MarR family transcriptional regulator, organic hydroperoxide resistance regulator